MKDLRIVFMGTPDFAVASLKTLVNDGFNIVGIITVPDKPAGRGKKISESAVKKFALQKNLNILQPSNLKDPDFINELKSLQANLQVVVAFRMLPQVVWDMPEFGTFNLHASLLPQYRGAAPINWAIINGETKTGITTFFLDQEIDTGKIIFQEEIEIEINDTAGILHDKLMVHGASLVSDTAKAIKNNKVLSLKHQSDLTENTKLNIAPKIHKEDCRINWSDIAENIQNFIRGMSPYPAAFTELVMPNKHTYSLKIFSSVISETQTDKKPGSILTDNKSFLKIASSNAWLDIKDLQLAGKKRMKTEDFLRGFNIENGSIVR